MTSAVPTIAKTETDALQSSWQINPSDVGLGVYNPTTGEIHVAPFDAHGGHDLFLKSLGLTDSMEWRGFIVTSDGQAINMSGLNHGLGFGMGMTPADFQRVLDALIQAGLTAP